MADQVRRGFGVGEALLIAVALCVMVAIGMAAASAFTAEPPVDAAGVPAATDTATAAPEPLQPVVPEAAAITPPSSGSQVSGDWVSATSQRTGIGEVAVRAYGSAALRLASEQPACRLGWTTLAGIGGVESLHGTDGGAYLLTDGRTSQPIVGPALDGTDGNAAIRATPETTEWHGDPTWDHAVGPMQFIPSTWERWASDGDGDGVTDPSDIADAAYAAGRYLCASGGDLTTAQGWTAAIFSYNHSDDYVRTVLAYANAYAS
ncbi:lytic transglycosylase domain-containing protein [Aeromicrobium sp. CFBP 8757]|uniref:lytic transglycosylase domain-containing protein n=1 Tax=Aeromicrobium sp. CFBP 8757 TaxID=2775288 RepID=UPI0035300DB0